MKPFNRSSVASDGSGRDMYIVMEKPVRDGRAEHKDQGNWMPNLRSPPPHVCHHMKGHELWYSPGKRGPQWSPPARQRSGSLPQPAWGENTDARPLAEAPGEKALRGMLKRTSTSFMLRANPSPGIFLSSVTALPSGATTDANSRSTSPLRHTSPRVSGHTASSPPPGSRIEQAFLARAASTFRLRARPQAAAYSFGKPPA